VLKETYNDLPGHKEFARSSNGDRWLLTKDGDLGLPYVLHEANTPSGGALTRFDIGTFLNRNPEHPETQQLLRLIGTLTDG
jgi:hypothetical protein